MLSLLLIKISLESKRASPKKRARLQSLALSFQEIHLLKVHQGPWTQVKEH